VRRRRRLLLIAAVAVAGALVIVGVTVLPTSGTKPHPRHRSADSVAFIDARGGGLGTDVALAGDPTAVAAGEGALWVVDSSRNSVVRIDPVSGTVVQTIPVGVNPAGIAVGGGSVWVANHDDNTVYRISPESDTVVEQIRVGAGPVAVASGFGAIWVTNSYDRTLTRIDANTGSVMKTIRTNAVGRGVTVGGGSVWVSDEATNRVVGVDPASDQVAATVNVGTGPTDLDFGAGSIWVVNALAGTVSQVDVTTLDVRATIPVPGGPSELSVAPGVVWVSAEFASRVYRIDPARDALVGSTALGRTPEGLVSSGAGVWVAARASGTGHRGGRLSVVSSADLGSSVDPAIGDFFGGWGEPAYDALTGLRKTGGAAGTQIVPDLAVALPEPTSAGTSYTFRLRPGIRYSDGRPLYAADFRRALERILEFSPGFPASYAPIIGAPDCTRSRCDLSRGVIVRGTSTITFRLSTPDPSLFTDLSLLVPVPTGTPDKDVGTAPVPGTGPYAVQTFVPNRLVTFERNRYFHVWSAAARPDGYPDEIVYRFGWDQDDAAHQVLDEHVDLVDLLGEPATVAQLATQHPGQVHLVDEHAVVFVFLNVRRPPFDDIRVRRALNYAIDRGRTAALNGTPGLARPTCQIVAPTVTGYKAYCPYTIEPDAQGSWTAPDLATARSLVAASRTKGQAIALWAFSEYLPQAKYVVAVLNGLGYRARVHEVSGDYFAILDKTPDVQAGMFGWFGANNAADMLTPLKCGFEQNPSHFCDARIDTQIAQLAAREPTDPAGTADLAAGIDRELTDKAPWVPLFTPRDVDVTSARVGNYQAQNGVVLIDQLWVK
ncbi:MAG TPA: ABC transporter substrate-binding protein, partial [Jatrophihabitantaceae bacterium]